MPRVLVIDDDEQYLALMEAMLARMGYEVLAADNGKQGIRMCENTRMDLVVTDVVMPEMEGLEVIMELRRKCPDVKIIAISGGGYNHPTDYLNLAAGLGADSTLTKPFSNKDLLESIKQLLG
jgi:CheY-like chemotaxis protein